MTNYPLTNLEKIRKVGAVKKSKNERMRGVEGSQSPLVGCYWATDREK